MDYLAKLNNKQQEAVLNTEGYLRVVAGAGSGKTKLLVSRYAYLVKEYGIDAANILCVTFTNKAAGEMKKRIRDLIGEMYDTTLVCTYHGFCNRLIREDSQKLFMDKQFQIIDAYQQKAILGEIYQKYELKMDYASFEKTLKDIARYKSENDYVPRICDTESGQILDRIADQNDQIIEDYLQKQKATYCLDFQDLICFAIYMLEHEPDVREKWQDRLNYIMVDEFQDSSGIEMKLIDILSQKYGNLMIVGDSDQNIYEWRGSDVSLLVDFDKTHNDTKTVILDQNYRSTPEILKCANTLIEKNTMRLEKNLFTKNPGGIEVIHHHSKSDVDEAEQIIKNIKFLRRTDDQNYSDFAVLYRSGFLSRIIEKKFVEKNIPYEIFGGVKFYQRMEILDILAYLKLIEYDDDTSFRRIANTPRRRFGRSKMNRLELLKEEGYQSDLFSINEDGGSKSLFNTLANNMSEDLFIQSDISSLVNLVRSIRERKSGMRISEIVNEVTSMSGYEQYIRELGDEERLENLSEFKRIANEFEREFGEDLTLDGFLKQIALQSGEDSDSETDTVKLMTIHAAKGLEFPCVFVVGLSEGIFPSSKTIEERKLLGLEEERRLCYVAITRAEKQLFLMESEGASPNGIKKLYSRFLDEIGHENYTTIGQMSHDFKAESRAYQRKLDQKLIDTPAPVIYSTNDEVEHHIFGKGKIIARDDKRNSYTIKFDRLDKPRNISGDYFNKPEKEQPAVKEQPYTEVDIPDIDEWIKESEEEEEENDDEMSLEELKRNTPNLLNDPSVPKTGWSCAGITDLGSPATVCQLCGKQIIRFVHHMTNPMFRQLDCGCVCAGKLEGNVDNARKRELEFKKKQPSKTDQLDRSVWRISQNGNPYCKIKNHLIILSRKNKTENGAWWYSIDHVFSTQYFRSMNAAAEAAMKAVAEM